MYLHIVFIHKGYSSYMEYSLRQAKYTNPNSEIILLGDESNNRFSFVTHINIKNYFKKASEFAKIYKHYSTNPYNYELFCFQRWLILEEFLQQKDYEAIMVSDSDVMLYTNITEVYNSFYKDCNISCLYEIETKIASIGFCYIKTKILKKFNNFMVLSYSSPKFCELMKNSWEQDIRKNKVGGNISDMRLVTEFLQSEKEKLKFYSLNKVKVDSVFDNNINESSCYYSNEYAYHFGKKKIKWNKGIPFCFNIKEKKLVKFHCLHFQGPAKYLMTYFYTGNSFRGKKWLDVKFMVLNFLAFIYKTLKIRYRFYFVFNYFHSKQ